MLQLRGTCKLVITPSALLQHPWLGSAHHIEIAAAANRRHPHTCLACQHAALCQKRYEQSSCLLSRLPVLHIMFGVIAPHQPGILCNLWNE